MNANVLHSSDGSGELHFVRKFNSTMIISDNDIPDMEGTELERNLKSDPMTAHIPIVINTGQDSVANHQFLLQFCAIDVLNRPIRAGQFTDILNHVETGEVTITV